MSDTRNEAEQEMVSAGMASGLEDSLGSALESSFSLPPLPKKKEESKSMMAAVAQADAANPNTVSPEDETTETQAEIPGMAEWKDTYEGYLHHWHEESAEARKKAQETRERIERERAEEEKKVKDKSKAEKDALKAKEKAEKDALKLKEELEGKKAAKLKNSSGSAEREQKVKEAWELIKSSGEGEHHEVTTDARGVMPEDVAAGQALPAGEHRPKVQQTAYDPTTSTEPLPPSMSDSPSPSTSAPTESATLSRHSATSQAWEEVSGPSSSSPSNGSSDSNDDIIRVSHPRDRSTSNAQPHSQQTPPAAPPSLTLSLFTMPGHLSLGRITAVLGINLVLPFINGVMLGFGEIFAREAIRVGRVWYRDGRSFFGLFGRRQGGAGAASNVGLSGSRGF